MTCHVLVVICALFVSAPAFGEITLGQTGSAFSLSNINDSTFSLASPRTRPVVLIFTTKDLGDYSLAWRDSLASRLGNTVEIQTIIDLSDVSSWQRGLAKVRMKMKGSRALLDWDGRTAGAWRGTRRDQVVVIGVTPDNVARFRAVGAATPENVAAATEAIRQMSR